MTATTVTIQTDPNPQDTLQNMHFCPPSAHVVVRVNTFLYRKEGTNATLSPATPTIALAAEAQQAAESWQSRSISPEMQYWAIDINTGQPIGKYAQQKARLDSYRNPTQVCA